MFYFLQNGGTSQLSTGLARQVFVAVVFIGVVFFVVVFDVVVFDGVVLVVAMVVFVYTLLSLDQIPGQAAVLHDSEPVCPAGQAAPPQEAGVVTLRLLLLVQDPHDLEQVPHEVQGDTEQLTVRKKR